jgi:hypothetical protein
MVLGVAGAAFADSVTYTVPASNTGDPVDVKATVNPKIELTVDTPDASQTVDFGAVDPGVAVTDSVTVTVKSNKAWTGSSVLGGDATSIGLTTSTNSNWAGMSGYGAKGVKSFTDSYSIDVPWTTDPANYIGTVTYTVTQ